MKQQRGYLEAFDLLELLSFSLKMSEMKGLFIALVMNSSFDMSPSLSTSIVALGKIFQNTLDQHPTQKTL